MNMTGVFAGAAITDILGNLPTLVILAMTSPC